MPNTPSHSHHPETLTYRNLLCICIQDEHITALSTPFLRQLAGLVIEAAPSKPLSTPRLSDASMRHVMAAAPLAEARDLLAERRVLVGGAGRRAQ